jgi:hypothetical protein
MRTLLIDADSKDGFPNLALMKLSAWLKKQDHSVELIRGIPDTAPFEHYDQVWLSCIYFQNESKARDYLRQFPNDTEVMFGGSGFRDFKVKLGSAIEHIMPDYSLYGVDFSMGFTSRGCIRKCPWCIVPQKEGGIIDHASITEFHHPDHKKIILLDNNYFASPKWEENLRYINKHMLKVNFNQGLDIRTISNRKAVLLSETRAYDWHFKTRGFHVAFDSMKIEKSFLTGMKRLFDNGIKPSHVMVYVLVGFDTTLEQDFYRIEKIIELGSKPYVMPYNKAHLRDDKIKHLARWINRKYYEFIPREAYKGGVLEGGL